MDHAQRDLFYADPRIGTSDIDTYTAMPHPAHDYPEGCHCGSWVVVAGDTSGEADVWIEVTAEYPQAVAEFLVRAVTNEWARVHAEEAAADEMTKLGQELGLGDGPMPGKGSA